MLIAHATSVVQQRAFAQESADSIALAAAIGGTSAAQQLETILAVTITELEIASDHVMVKVESDGFIATAEATAVR
jgi:hypothetical protein